jgi:DnaJ-class molecular chaperone
MKKYLITQIFLRDCSFLGEKFNEIKKAYSVLSDPKERELYDIFLGTGLAVPFEFWKKEHETHGAVHWRGKQ